MLVVLDNSVNQGDVITRIINLITLYFSPANRQMGENIYISEIRRNIQDQNGVISISNIKIYNNVGGQYSSSQTSQNYLDTQTREIELIDDIIFAEPNQIYQIRFPTKDIRVRVKDFRTVTIS